MDKQRLEINLDDGLRAVKIGDLRAVNTQRTDSDLRVVKTGSYA